ncbi:MAG: DNA polymerase III subunit epsilon [Lachnospiraceae bacterium]|jgi:DNA polymerase III epsilon subunit family exonuclease|nr:DNA polymerase III subunit epsilon [Lachnospiraceae bacterium]
MLSTKGGKHLNTYVKDYVVFDLETTGISVYKDEVVEISAVKVADGKVVDEFSTLVNPGMPIPPDASSVNGITDDMVADAPVFEKALKDFLDFAGDHVLVGHNIQSFDMKFICRDALKFYGKTVGNDFVDTLKIAQAYLPELRHHTLTDLACHYRIDAAGAHRALNDCRMNQKVFECLAKEIENPSEAARNVRKCPLCGCVLRLRSGRYGDFWGCTGYPDCRYTENKA